MVDLINIGTLARSRMIDQTTARHRANGPPPAEEAHLPSHGYSTHLYPARVPRSTHRSASCAATHRLLLLTAMGLAGQSHSNSYTSISIFTPRLESRLQRRRSRAANCPTASEWDAPRGTHGLVFNGAKAGTDSSPAQVIRTNPLRCGHTTSGWRHASFRCSRSGDRCVPSSSFATSKTPADYLLADGHYLLTI